MYECSNRRCVHEVTYPMCEDYPHPHQHFTFFILAILVGLKYCYHCGFDLHFLMSKDAEYLFMC